MLKRIILLCSMLVVCILSSLTVEASAQETGFLTSEKPTFLYMDTRQMNVSYDDESLKFVLQRDGVLKLMSRDGQNDYMSFRSYDGESSGVGYQVREIYSIFPSMQFFEINADRGAHAKNCGYWLIGKRNGQWVIFVSLDSLATVGYTPGQWHHISTVTNGDATGRFILTSQHEYMPTGAQYGYQRRYAVDLRVQLFWDQSAQWFGLRRL